MNFLELAQNIRNSVAKDHIKQAITELQSGLTDMPELDQVIIHSARYEALKKSIHNGTTGTEWVSLENNRIRNALLELVRELEGRGKADTQIFICYHDDATSKSIAQIIYQKLKEHSFNPFIDEKDVPIGQDWATTILGTLRASDYLILLLSKEANNSEMILKEIEEARNQQLKTGRPLILPIKIEWPENLFLNYKLHDWLHRIQHLTWGQEADTPIILDQLLKVISQRQTLHITESVSSTEADAFAENLQIPPSPVAPLEVPQGSVLLQSHFYISRENEQDFIQRIKDSKALLRIRGPRQYGKTSLLSRVVAYAREQGYIIVSMDFLNLIENTISNIDILIWEFCYMIATKVDLEDEFEDYWDKKLSKRPNRDKKQIAHTFIEKQILPGLESNLLVAIDEADRIFTYQKVSDEFFLMLRSWHEYATTQPIWEKFKLVISYSTEAKLAISNLNASPFNVGEEARLDPFNELEVKQLIQLHGLELSTIEINQIMKLLGGQPYLIRRSLYLLAKNRYDFNQLISEATSDQGPFSDHLRHHLVNLCQFPELSDALKTIIRTNKCKEPLLAARLNAAGLVNGTPPSDVSIACGLYGEYFKNKL